ncbi:MAG: PH domain-containing protein [Eggerthellaceae bacterium]|nr:PH domain-containing protein [Eggerthellaceae bacterium]
MQSQLKEKLNPKIKKVWAIASALWVFFMGAIFVVPFLFLYLEENSQWSFILLLVFAALAVLSLIVAAFVLPSIRYIRWSYQVGNDFIEIKRGIWWRKHYMIPFIRVQNTDTKQGPLLRAFGLSDVTISTAAGEHTIPGLLNSEAEELRDRAAELARIAREDV